MQKKGVAIDEGPAPAIEPEMLTELKKEDMQQAVVERFKIKVKAPGVRAVKPR
jgi:hypothetical protein